MKIRFKTLRQWRADRRERARNREWASVFLLWPRRNSAHIPSLGVDPRDIHWGRTMRVWSSHDDVYGFLYASPGDVIAAKLNHPDRMIYDHIESALRWNRHLASSRR